MNKEKIIGFYAQDDYDKNNNPTKLYCYVSKDIKTGKLSYHFTHDRKEALNALAKYGNDNGYNKTNKEKIFTDDYNKVNVHCDNTVEIFNRIKEANKDADIDLEEFRRSKYDYEKSYYGDDNKKKSKFDLLKDKFLPTKDGKWFKFKKKDKKSKLPKSVKKIKIAGACIALAVAGITLTLASKHFGGPTNNTSKVAKTIDDDDKLDTKQEKETPEKDKEEPKKEEKKTTTTSEVKQVASSNSEYNNYSSSSTDSSSTPSYEEPVYQEPGTSNEDMPSFQDPNESLDNSELEEPTQPEDSNDNIFEEDTTVPVEGEEIPPVEDEDYSEIIDVPVESEDNLSKDDVDSSDKFEGNEGAFDNDLTYEDDGKAPSAMPDPNDTATGDYVTTEEELQENQNAPIETVPVEQDSAPVDDVNYTEQNTTETVPVEQNSTPVDDVNYTEQSATETVPVEQAVDQAIEAMANGQDVNLVYNSTDNTMSIEQNLNTNTETNSLTK